MKTYKNLYINMLDKDLINQCISDASKNKRTKGRKDVQWVKNNRERAVDKVYDILFNKNFEPAHKTKTTINEYSTLKTREIVKPRYKFDQIIHHVAMTQFVPIALKGAYEFSVASIPGKGDKFGVKHVKKWIRSYGDKKFYVLKMDVHHFFASIDKRILKRKLERIINDKDYLELLFKIIDTGTDEGLPLGFYTSQWFANFYLQELDHYIKQELGAEYYMRYMDDMVVLGTNKRKLHKIKRAVEEFLNNNLNLELKGDWQVFRFEYVDRKTGKTKGRFLDYMGFQFHRDRTTLRKSTLKKIRRKALRIHKKSRTTFFDACQMMSYLARLRRCKTYNYYLKYIKHNCPVKRRLKKIISNHYKKEKRKNDRLEDRTRNAA